MNAIKDVRVLPMDGHEEFARAAWSPRRPHNRRSITPLMAAIVRARQRLLGEQRPEGDWVGTWEGSSAAESETILMLARFGLSGSELARHVTRSLAAKQLADGGWARYPGEAANLNDSVKACLALKVMGYPPGDESMTRARAAILAKGGAGRVDGPTRLLLAVFGQLPFDKCPRLSIERVLLSRWFSVGRAEWNARSVPAAAALALASAVRPVVNLEPEKGLREFFLTEPEQWPPGDSGRSRRFLFLWDRAGQSVQRLLDTRLVRRWLPLRRWAIVRIERWLVEHITLAEDPEPDLSALLWTTLALDCLGYAQDTPEVQRCFQKLEALVVRRKTASAVAPRRTPIRDTAQAVRALMESGTGSCQAGLCRGRAWLVDSFAGSSTSQSAAADQPRASAARPDGERRPGVVSTALALAALRPPGPQTVPEDDALPPEIHVLADDERIDDDDPTFEIEALGRVAAAGKRAGVWLAEQQNRDGGWGDVPRRCAPPWDGRASAAGRSWPAITGLVLEGLGARSYNRDDRFVEGGVCYLQKAQQADGSWTGRTPGHSIRATSLCVTGLRAVGVPPGDRLVEKAVYWLLARQQASGAWGESLQTDADPCNSLSGPTTASYTAWSVSALTAAGLEKHPAVVRGVRHLLDTQEPDGRWADAAFVPSLFPEMSHGRNSLDATCFALGALARWAAAIGSLLHEVDAACQCLIDPAERDFDGR